MDCCQELVKILSNNSVQWFTLLLTFLSTILWGVYVYFTRLTFQEIRAQTILQSRGFLVVKPILDETPIELKKFNNITVEKHNHWKGILEKFLSAAIIQERKLILRLINRGKSDITSWSINVAVKVAEGDYLYKQSIRGGIFNFTINSTISNQIGPSEYIDVEILPYGYYPKAEIMWTINYKDFRANEDKVNDIYTVYNSIAWGDDQRSQSDASAIILPEG